MAKKTPVWFENKVTGSVQAVPKGSPAHQRMLTTLHDGVDGPEATWREVAAPATSSPKFKSGLEALVHKGPNKPEPDDEPEPAKEPGKPKDPELPEDPAKEPEPKGDGK